MFVAVNYSGYSYSGCSIVVLGRADTLKHLWAVLAADHPEKYAEIFTETDYAALLERCKPPKVFQEAR
jgi:hypothetical protein